MFEQLLSFDGYKHTRGIIWSLTGSHYLAYELSPQGKVVKQSRQGFSNLASARSWLRKQGVTTISLRQSGAYLEMIGHSTQTSLD